MRRLYQQVAEQLRERISGGLYPLNERIPAERVLAKEFNVSRPTVREAIIALEIEGLVSVRTGSGVYVASREPTAAAPNERDVGPFELLEARRSIEGEIAAAAAAHINSEQIAALELQLDEMRRENEARRGTERADRAFHLLIAEATQNPAFVAVTERLWDMRETSTMLTATMQRAREGGIQPTLDDHRVILDALRRGDADGARAAMHGHLSRVMDGLLRMTETEAIKRAREDAQALRSRYSAPPAVAEAS
jgi:GntR family transcriptional regulator, hexuronate regulon transcriptional repressor